MKRTVKTLNIPYLILEVANVHGGDAAHFHKVIRSLKEINYPHFAVKFQPLHADKIAMPDYKWYSVYEELYFSVAEWAFAIGEASNYCDVWLDIFDEYGVEILRENLSKVRGIKLQASVLENYQVLSLLQELETKTKKLIINISGHDLTSAEYFINDQRWNQFEEVIIQVGFQAYPTSIQDTALQKIPVLKTVFPLHNICLADHSPATSSISLDIPGWGVLLGCTYIEKHFCFSREKSKYDYFSALELDEVLHLIGKLENVVMASTGSFVNEEEKKYLETTIQIPISNRDIAPGELLSAKDFAYRRTSEEGLYAKDILSFQSRFNVIGEGVQANRAIKKEDFRKARIGVIVACRMKSSRLKNKASLPILGVPSIERCLSNCQKIPFADEVILATSDLEEDNVLSSHVMSGAVRFWQGDPDDVIKRYLGACKEYEIDVIVRVTGDCPVVSSDIAELLLTEHFKNGADYTAALTSAIGSSVEIYNTEALQRVINIKGSAPHSEYMTWYMRNNSNLFKNHFVNLHKNWVRDYRLTLDYDEDLEMFEQLFCELEKRNLDPTIKNIFTVLDENKNIVDLNQHIGLTYKTDRKLIELLDRETKIKCA